jgi:ATP-dependent Clp protease protease subunit
MNKIDKFWNWARDADTGERTLYLNGPIGEETWLGDTITPRMFREELMSGTGKVTIVLNSMGGDVFAATEIYNALLDYPGSVNVRIDALAASAASIIACAGETVYMSPVSMMMLHNPSTIAIGDSEEMLRAKAMLDAVKDAIVGAYELKTGLSRAKLSRLMDAETWLNAPKAIELGFADALWTANDNSYPPGQPEPAIMFSRAAVLNSIIDKLPNARDQPAPPKQPEPPKPEQPSGVPHETLSQRLLSLVR